MRYEDRNQRRREFEENDMIYDDYDMDEYEDEYSDNDEYEEPVRVNKRKPKSNSFFSVLGRLIYKMPFSTTIFFALLMIYYEVVFHGFSFKLHDGNMSNIIMFAIASGMAISVVTNLFGQKVNRAIAIIFTALASLLFMIQFVYHAVFNNYFSLSGTIQYADQAADNYQIVMKNIKEHIGAIILFILPIILVALIFRKTFEFKRRKWWQTIILIATVAFVYLMTILAMKSNKDQLYSAYDMYKNYTSVDMSIQKLGVIETYVVDVRQGIKGKMGVKDETVEFEAVTTETPATSEEDSSATEQETVVDTSPNVMNIDFDELNAATSDSNLQSLNNYFSSLTPTNKNEYTGMFKGYNLIWITAEGFSGYVLESGKCPTLSMMANQGFVFKNYYSPLWYGSTLGGEYANLLGDIPKNGGYLSLSHAAEQGNDFAFSIANQLKRLGYTTYGFHNNSYTYYDRNITHPALGYTWIANGSGLDPQTNSNGKTLWPQSDLVMIQDTFDTYKDQQPFHAYYMTVSGHADYTWGGNAMSTRHKDDVADLSYNDITKGYVAAQYELELAMEQLVTYLKDNNLYDNTVIVLAGDHVPYNNMDVLDVLAGRTLETNFEAYKSTLIIWSGAMTEPVNVDKVCSSIDILPTVSNLFGVEYDSRLIIGQDILSTSPGLVMFNNRSFLTDDFEYNATNNKVTSLSGKNIDDDTVANMNAIVANKFTAADSITTYDYYKYVEKYRTPVQ